ncbi:hypothetical protein ENUP19_0113G0012 [Entamoeba nuttalli]|uniref:Myb family DNA-binding domain containing protein n=2 Tax=Entamoeba nuttalli TaxID=412467 RepID=A0ABQ0DI29_9EUKA
MEICASSLRGSDSPELDKKNKKVVKVWTKQEDKLLLEGIAKYGSKNSWDKIAIMIPGRNRKQCREHFINKFNNIRHRPWTSEEDNEILTRRKEFGNRWTQIATFLDGRSPNDVKNRFFGRLKYQITNELKQNALSVFKPMDHSLFCVI